MARAKTKGTSMRYIEVQLTRSVECIVNTKVLPWEVDVLIALHGPEHVLEVAEHFVEARLADENPHSEYNRLEQAYGFDREDSGQSWVALAYGAGEPGVRKLAAAMTAEGITFGDMTGAEAAAIKPRLSQRNREAALADPLIA